MAAKKGNRVGVWIILILLFVGLIGFGASGLSGNVRTLGTVGDKPLTVQQYANALSEQLRSFSAQIGIPLTLAQAQSFGIDRAVLAQLVTERALDNEATRLGLSVGDEQVRDRVLSYDAFQGLDGSFDREAYRFSLENAGLSEAEFETSLRDDASRALLQGAVISGIAEPATYADAIAAYIGEQRDLTWIALTADDLTSLPPTPLDEELRAHWEANPEAFTAPEIRKISYAWLTPEMIQDTVTVDEVALRALYDERIDQFVQAERRLVERLVMPDQASAEAARTALDAGEADFEGLVADRGLQLTDVDLGDVTSDQLGAAGDPVFAAAPGDVLGPIETALGPAFYRLNAVLAAQEVSFDEARDDLREELAAARARRIIQDATDGLTDLIAGGATLEDLADRSDLELGQIDWSDGASDGIAAYDEFRAAAAVAAEGDFPELVQLEDGGIFALRLDSVVAPTLIPFEDARDAVSAAWLVEATHDAILARAEVLAQSVRDNGVVQLDGRSAVTERSITRRDFIAGTPEGFLTEVFAMDEGEVRVLPSDDGAVVVRLVGIAPADLASETMTAERAAIAERVSQGIAQDIYGAFATAIQAQTEVRINDAAVNAVHAQFQ